MIILVSGKMGSGKSTLSRNLKLRFEADGFEVLYVRFAAPLYEMHDRVLGVLSDLGIPVPKKDGKLLQLLGTDWGRAEFGDNIWVNLTRKKIEWFMSGENPEKRVVILDDCRFKNELFGFPEAFKVRLVCDRDARKGRADAWRESENHQSEVDLDDVGQDAFDIVLDTGLYTSGEVVQNVYVHSLMVGATNGEVQINPENLGRGYKINRL